MIMWGNAKMLGQKRSEESMQDIDKTRIKKGLKPIFHKKEFYEV